MKGGGGYGGGGDGFIGIDGGKNGYQDGYKKDPVGPWEDLLCYFPGAGRNARLHESVKCTTYKDMEDVTQARVVKWTHPTNNVTLHQYSLRRLPARSSSGATHIPMSPSLNFSPSLKPWRGS